jgi:YidC/Oxa1 family membrane protein insertase
VWHAFVELIQALIFSVAHVCGGNVGAAIAIVSFTIRLALVPLTRRVMQRAREKQAQLEALKPQLARLQRRYAKDQVRLAEETLALYKRNGIRMLDPLTVVSYLVQAPLFGGLYAAVRAGLGAGRRFLWVADLSRPDGWLALTAALLVGAATLASAQQGGAGQATATAMRVSAVISAVMTLALMWAVPGAVVVSVAAGAVGSAASLIGGHTGTTRRLGTR